VTNQTPNTPRLGAIYPDDMWVDLDAQTVVDDFRSYLPESVELISSATPIPPRDAALKAGIELAENGDIEESARRLLRYHPSCFAYYCTTISFVRGVGGDLDISRRVEAATGKPAVTTSTAMIRAFEALGIKSVVLASPYMPDVEEKFVEFIEAHGVRVLKSLALGLKDGHGIVDPNEIRQLAESADKPEADAVFVGCTGQRLAAHLDEMEAGLGKPVLCANQVTSWEALRLLGVPRVLSGRGSLFSGAGVSRA